MFKYGPAVGAGWTNLKLTGEGSMNPEADEVVIDYSKKEVADFENLHLHILRKPPDENCWSCHSMAHGRRGRLWNQETDIHKAKGFECVTCHPGDKEHNFAKGNTLQETVRNDLDNTMHSCEDCHYKGKDKKAPRFRHPFSPRHMKIIACETCHIPFQAGPTDLFYDHVSTGETIIHDTSKFLSSDPLDPKKPAPGVDPWIWRPSFKKWKGRFIPVKSILTAYWGDLNAATNAIKPIALWKIRELKKPPLRDDDADGIPEVNTLEEIKSFLKALKVKDKFGNPVAQQPVLIKGEFLYKLDKKGEVEKIRRPQSDSLDYSISHNVAAGEKVIGAKGCKDCHSRKSPFFLRKILVDPWDEKGKPVYMEAWEVLGIDKEKLGRLLLEQ
jgi:hypothetical protein